MVLGGAGVKYRGSHGGGFQYRQTMDMDTVDIKIVGIKTVDVKITDAKILTIYYSTLC